MNVWEVHEQMSRAVSVWGGRLQRCIHRPWHVQMGRRNTKKKKKRTWRSTVLEHLFVLVFGFQSENGMSRRKKNPSDVWGLGCVNDFISMEPVTLTFLCLILPLNLYIQYSVMILSQYYYTVLHSVRWCAVLKDRQRHLSEVDLKIYFMWNVSTKGNWRKYNCCIVLYKAGAHVYFFQLSCRKILHLCVCVCV